MNKKFPTDKELPVTFVAANLTNLPTSTRESEAAILNRLKMLEIQMAATCTSNELLQLDAKVNRITSGRPTEQERRHDETLHRPMIAVSDESMATGMPSNASTTAPVGASGRGPAPAPRSATAMRAKYSDIATSLPTNRPPYGQLGDQQPSKDDFQPVLGRRRNRKRPPVVYGTNTNTTLKAGPCRHEIFVFRVDSETTVDDIKEFVKGDNRSVTDIECKSSADSWTKCYRLVVQCPDIEPLLDPTFWGNGIGVRRYFNRKNRTL